MTTQASESDGREWRAGALAVAVVASVVYWRTAHPTITWWDASNYSTAAATLGVTGPPGSLLLTLLGAPLTKLAFGASPAYVLNLFAGLLGAVTVALVVVVSRDLLVAAAPGDFDGSRRSLAAVLGAATGALALAFGPTLWEYSTKFTPYVLTTVFTGLILWTMIRWWREADRVDAWRWLLLLAFLFGLDFSVHRTNALLMPGALAWVLVRDARVMLRWRTWAAAVGGMAIGLSFHLLVIPLARTTDSPINMFPPTTLSAFWDYVSLAGSGGGFRMNLWPRNADFWSVQVADFARTMRDTFMNLRGPLGPVGIVPALAGVAGIAALWRAQRRLAIAFVLLLTSHALLTVVYFNIPAQYFRSLDRHYLPVAVTFAVLVAYGLARVAARVRGLHDARLRVVAVATVIGALVALSQLAANWTGQDASSRHFAHDYATNALDALPPNAIYFTVGDNDTFPVWYVQSVEHVRPDVQIVNLSMANADWYVEQLARDPSFPIALDAEERTALGERLGSGDTTIVVPSANVRGDTVALRVQPAFGSYQPADIMLMDLVSTNAWRRPLTFASTAAGALGWLRSNARLEGLHWRVLPDSVAVGETEPLRANLDGYRIRGFAGDGGPLERESVIIGMQYIRAFTALMDADAKVGSAECRETARRVLSLFPPERMGVPEYDASTIRERCGGA